MTHRDYSCIPYTLYYCNRILLHYFTTLLYYNTLLFCFHLGRALEEGGEEGMGQEAIFTALSYYYITLLQ